MAQAQDSHLDVSPVNSDSGTGRVPAKVLLTWAPPLLALSAPFFFVQFYFLNFATDVLLLPPLAVSGIFASARAWDAISDPIVGTWSDRTSTRLGRRRPWMFAGIPLYGVALWMIWSPPDLPPLELSVWVAVGMFAFYSAFTMYNVPHMAVGTELTDDHHDRSRIFGTQGAFFMSGMMFGFGFIQIVSTAEVPREAAGDLVLGIVAISVIVLLIPPLFIRERPEFQGRGASSSFVAMRDVLRNPHARLLLLAQFVQMAGTGVLGVMAPYLMKYVLRRPDLIAKVPGLFVVCTLVSIPLWVLLSRRLGKRNAWIIGMVGSGLSFGSIAFLEPEAVVSVTIAMICAGLFSGSGSTVGPSILADVIDSDELTTGERKEGAYAAAWGFAIKSASALMILAAGAALQFSDFTPNEEQSEATISMLQGMNGLVPLFMYFMGAFLFRNFALNEAEHSEIRAQLDRRRNRD